MHDVVCYVARVRAHQGSRALGTRQGNTVVRSIAAALVVALVAPLFDPIPVATADPVSADFTATPTSGELSATAGRTNFVRSPRAGGTASYTAIEQYSADYAPHYAADGIATNSGALKASWSAIE